MKKLLLAFLLSTGLYASQENTDNTSSFEDTAKGPGYNDYDSDDNTELALLLSTGVYTSQENNQSSQLDLDFLNKNTSKDLYDLLLELDQRDLEFDQQNTEHISTSKQSSINLKDAEEEKEEDIDSLLARIENDIIAQQNTTTRLSEYEKNSNPKNKRKKIDIDRNQTSNSNKKPHQCTHEGCDYSTAYKGDLTIHIRAIHTKEKPHQCSHCDYSTAKKSDLKKHINRRHKDEKSDEHTSINKQSSINLKDIEEKDEDDDDNDNDNDQSNFINKRKKTDTNPTSPTTPTQTISSLAASQSTTNPADHITTALNSTTNPQTNTEKNNINALNVINVLPKKAT